MIGRRIKLWSGKGDVIVGMEVIAIELCEKVMKVRRVGDIVVSFVGF